MFFSPVLQYLRIIEKRLPFSPLSPWGPTSPFNPGFPGNPEAPVSPEGPACPLWPGCPFIPGKKEQIKQLNGYSLFLRPLKLRSKIFPKRFHRNRSNFATIEAAKGGTSSLKRFSKKLRYREIQKQVEDVMAPLRCHGNSDVNQR